MRSSRFSKELSPKACGKFPKIPQSPNSPQRKDDEMSLQTTLKALADPTRREIMNLLKGGELSAGEIAERFDISGAAISRHLSVLREADLIRDRRDGKFIFYELNASVLEEIILWIKDFGGNEND